MYTKNSNTLDNNTIVNYLEFNGQVRAGSREWEIATACLENLMYNRKGKPLAFTYLTEVHGYPSGTLANIAGYGGNRLNWLIIEGDKCLVMGFENSYGEYQEDLISEARYLNNLEITSNYFNLPPIIVEPDPEAILGRLWRFYPATALEILNIVDGLKWYVEKDLKVIKSYEGEDPEFGELNYYKNKAEEALNRSVDVAGTFFPTKHNLKLGGDRATANQISWFSVCREDWFRSMNNIKQDVFITNLSKVIEMECYKHMTSRIISDTGYSEYVFNIKKCNLENIQKLAKTIFRVEEILEDITADYQEELDRLKS